MARKEYIVLKDVITKRKRHASRENVSRDHLKSALQDLFELLFEVNNADNGL